MITILPSSPKKALPFPTKYYDLINYSGELIPITAKASSTLRYVSIVYSYPSMVMNIASKRMNYPLEAKHWQFQSAIYKNHYHFDLPLRKVLALQKRD